MKIIDENGVEITNPDLSVGYLKEDIIIEHHEAVEGVEEQWHYETIAEYPETGGKDVEIVIDVPGVEAQEAWDEEISVYRYVLYTPEELAVTNSVIAPRNILAGEYITVKGVMYKAIENIPNGEPIIVGQNAYETTIEERLAELAKGE